MLLAIEDTFMVYHINDTANTMKPIDTESHLKTKQQDTTPAVDNASTETDSINFSATSKQLEALKASLRDLPEINQARVLYFKAEIEAGNYQINSDRIAKSMLNDLEMA